MRAAIQLTFDALLNRALQNIAKHLLNPLSEMGLVGGAGILVGWFEELAWSMRSLDAQSGGLSFQPKISPGGTLIGQGGPFEMPLIIRPT